jgi:hypothetical protein
MTNEILIEENNISLAWAQAFLRLVEPGVKEISPLVVIVDDLADTKPPEVPSIRAILDEALSASGKHACGTVASTIFPRSLWDPEKPRKELFARYERILPDLRKYHGNANGLYFERLIAFGGVNQLNHIIETRLGGNHRRSALQATIFDPNRDHTNQRQRGFPCLQQVIFLPRKNQELSITGVYTTQYVFERAYGNYLGLYHLGQFVAHELGLHLGRVMCISNTALLGGVKRHQVADLAKHVKAKLRENGHER